MHEKLGKTFTDTITGFKGVATGRIEYISGCNQLLITPKVGADGTLKDGAWFDEQRCVEEAQETKVKLNNGKTPGHGPLPTGHRRG